MVDPPVSRGISGVADRGTRRWIMAATILGSSMTFIDGTAVNVVLPLLERQLHATSAQVQWIVEAYLLLLTSLMLLGGAMGDRYGRRRIFVAGTILFAAAGAALGGTEPRTAHRESGCRAPEVPQARVRSAAPLDRCSRG